MYKDKNGEQWQCEADYLKVTKMSEKLRISRKKYYEKLKLSK